MQQLKKKTIWKVRIFTTIWISATIHKNNKTVQKCWEVYKNPNFCHINIFSQNEVSVPVGISVSYVLFLFDNFAKYFPFLASHSLWYVQCPLCINYTRFLAYTASFDLPHYSPELARFGQDYFLNYIHPAIVKIH